MQILVSVHTVEEAAQVIAAGVTLLDLKDPSQGALAVLPIEVSQDIVRFARAQSDALTISATVGDTYPGEALLQRMVSERVSLGIDILKFPVEIWHLRTQPWLETCHRHDVRCVAVFSPERLKKSDWRVDIEHCKTMGYQGIMLDTQNKQFSLFDSVHYGTLYDFVQSSKKQAFFVGLAGGLQLSHLETVYGSGADFIGLRGGLCLSAQRQNALDATRLQSLAAALQPTSV